MLYAALKRRSSTVLRASSRLLKRRSSTVLHASSRLLKRRSSTVLHRFTELPVVRCGAAEAAPFQIQRALQIRVRLLSKQRISFRLTPRRRRRRRIGRCLA